MTPRTRLSLGLASVPAAVWAAALWLAARHEATWLSLTREDGPIEWIQVVAVVIAAALAARVAARLRWASERGWVLGYAGLAVLLAVVAAEELSWGQRLLGLPTPEWLAWRNVQHEITAHNLPGVARALTRAADVLLVAVAGCAIVRRWPRRRAQAWPQAALWAVPLWLVPWLVASMGWVRAFILAQAAVFPRLVGSRLQELSELLLACTVVLFLAGVLQGMERGR